MEGLSIGFFSLIYGMIACFLASGSTLVISSIVILLSRRWPSMVWMESWQTVIAIFFLNLFLIFRALVSCGLVLCLL